MLKFIILLFVAVQANCQTIDIVGPFTGLNDTDSSVTIAENAAQDLLNVDVAANGLSISKRSGFSLDTALTYSTSAVTGSIKFRDVSGRNIRVFSYDRYIMASIDGGSYNSILSTYTAYANYSFCEANGSIYVFNDSHDTPFSWNGATVTYYPAWPKGSICAITPARLLISGTTDYPNRLYASAKGDYTDFTVGVEPEDPFFEAVGLQGDKITGLFTTQSEWIVFKPNSIITYQGDNQFDLVPSVISESKGCSNPRAIVYSEGVLYFLESMGKVYAYSAGVLTDISKNIETFSSNVSKNATLEVTYTLKSDFDNGTYSNSTGSVTAGSIEPLPYLTEDTLDADFNAGTIAGSSIVVSGNEFTMVNSVSDGYFENMGFETGTIISGGWYYANGAVSGAYTSTANVISTTDYYGAKSLKMETNTFPNPGVADSHITASCPAFPKTYTYNITEIAKSTITFPIPDCNGLSTTLSVWHGKGGIGAQINGSYVAASSITFMALLTGPVGISTTTATTLTIDFLSAPFSTSISSATFISRVATAAANTTNYGYIISTRTVGGGSVDFFVAHSSAVNGSFTNWAATTDYLLLTSTDTYWKYKANLYRGSTDILPSVQAVALTFEATGYWESENISLNDGITAWGVFVATETKNTGGPTHWTYQFKASTTLAGLASTPYYDITASSSIGIGVGAYAKVKAISTFTSATETVRMDSINFSYKKESENTASATAYLGDIYFAVPYLTSNTNNRIAKFVRDMSAWVIYDIPMVAPFVDSDIIYFGSPTTGNIYKWPSGNTDAGNAINSYFKSKNFIGSNPYVEKQFDRISMILDSDYGSTLDVTYTLDTATSTAYTVDLTSNTANFVRNNRTLPYGSNGSFFNLQIGNNASNQPWTFYGARIEYKDDPWRVLP